jgi:hypothetical protein
VKPRTLRRKLQKKLKHKPYRKCPKCGNRMNMVLREDDRHTWRLFKVCGHNIKNLYAGCEPYVSHVIAQGCGYFEELFYKRLSGGTGDTYPVK